MTGTFRTPQGGRVDRTKPLQFTFDGKRYTGVAGDTLASALLANGVHLVGRSFKYHRPRGILSVGAEEPNALVRIGRDESRCTPNLRATQVELFDGLAAESQNRVPSLNFDIGALTGIAAPFLPAGFYYKTFMWPAWAWHRWYEPAIRAMAGLGRAPAAPDADVYAQRYAHCDVLVTGAGPAGLAAALAAANAGARVILCDEQAEIGGSLLGAAPDSPDAAWLAETCAALAANDDVTCLPRTTAFGIFAQNFVALTQRVTDHLAAPNPAQPRERLWQVRAQQIVLATGAIERPMVFPDNDRPGIMLASAAQTYVTRYGVLPGTRAVVATTNDGGYATALAVAEAGIEITVIADIRAKADGPHANAARAAGLHVRTATEISGTHGRLRVSSANLITNGASRTNRIACDLLLMAGGFTPSVHLYSQARGALQFDAGLGAYIPEADLPGMVCAGACRGLFGTDAVKVDGHAAGIVAAQHANLAPGEPSRRMSLPLRAAPAPITQSPHSRAFVDFQNDVTSKDLALAGREGFVSVEHVKRYTTLGMATDQGKTSNINALGLMAESRGSAIPEIGLTTFRMPYTPVTFGALAGPARGDLFDPIRQTPLHQWAESHGAVFEDVGLWQRARYFPAPGESMAQAVQRECRVVRNAAGLFDASTLGKIEVVGPDAAIFLDRLYVSSLSRLAPGRARYAIMLREDGFIFDDGVIGRIAPDRFHVTTTTGGAARVLSMMEDFLQTEWPDLRVWLTPTTDEWAVIAVQGPLARQIIAPFIDGVDLSMPHMGLQEGSICGVKLRLLRVSFTGELGYELNIPAGYATVIWETLLNAGVPLGLTPYGTETMHVLRAEKGYIIIGQETDGTVTPDDVGLGWAVITAKGDFVGKRSLARAAMADPRRKQLVGLLTEDPNRILQEGAQIVAEPAGPAPRAMLGHVTSAYFSATLGRSIALAMVESGRARVGHHLYVPMPNATLKVRVTKPVFYDPSGERLNA